MSHPRSTEIQHSHRCRHTPFRSRRSRFGMCSCSDQDPHGCRSRSVHSRPRSARTDGFPHTFPQQTDSLQSSRTSRRLLPYQCSCRSRSMDCRHSRRCLGMCLHRTNSHRHTNMSTRLLRCRCSCHWPCTAHRNSRQHPRTTHHRRCIQKDTHRTHTHRPALPRHCSSRHRSTAIRDIRPYRRRSFRCQRSRHCMCSCTDRGHHGCMWRSSHNCPR